MDELLLCVCYKHAEVNAALEEHGHFLFVFGILNIPKFPTEDVNFVFTKKEITRNHKNTIQQASLE